MNGYTNEQHERHTLGIYLQEPRKIAEFDLQLDMFADARHRSLYEILCAMHFEGEAMDAANIFAFAQRRMHDVGGFDYLCDVLAKSDPPACLAFHAEALVIAFNQREAEKAFLVAQRDVLGGVEVSQAVEQLRSTIAELPKFGDEKTNERFPIISSAALASTEYAIDYHIPSLIVRGQPHVWGGPMKSLKTSTALDAAIAMATGGYFLGYLPAQQAEGVLFLSGESGLATLKETAQRICQAAGRNLADLSRLHWCTELPSLHDAADIRDLRAVMKRTGSDVLFIDPLYLCMPEVDTKASNMYAMGPLLRSLGSAMEADGVTTILLHHTTRQAGKDFEPLDLSSLAFSGICEYARAWVLVNRREKYVDGSGDHRLWLVAGGSAGHSNCWAVDIAEGVRDTIVGRSWHTQVRHRDDAQEDQRQRQDEAKERQQSAKAERDVERVINAVTKHPEGIVKTSIKDASGLKPAAFEVALALAINRDIIEPCDVIRANKQTYAGYRLKSLSTTQDHSGLSSGPDCHNTTQDLHPYRVQSGPECVVTGSKSVRVPRGTASDPIPFPGS